MLHSHFSFAWDKKGYTGIPVFLKIAGVAQPFQLALALVCGFADSEDSAQ